MPARKMTSSQNRPTVATRAAICRIVREAVLLCPPSGGQDLLEELQIPLNSAIGLDSANVPAASAPARGLGALLRETL